MSGVRCTAFVTSWLGARCAEAVVEDIRVLTVTAFVRVVVATLIAVL